MPSLTIRAATPEDALDCRRILDSAMLEPGDVETRIDAGDVLVATASRETASGDERSVVLGVLVLESVGEEPSPGATKAATNGAHIAAIAVRRRHRRRGIATTLIETALERERRLTATFDERVRPFYERLGFSLEKIDERRYRGVRSLEWY